VKKCLHSK